MGRSCRIRGSPEDIARSSRPSALSGAGPTSGVVVSFGARVHHRGVSSVPSHMRRGFLAVLVVVVPACYRYHPPAALSPREPTRVEASFGRTWDAVIDVFADQNIPISTMERVSGFIAAQRGSIPLALENERSLALAIADCGRFGPSPLFPWAAVYNVVVRGDSAASTIKVTASYASMGALATNPKRVTVRTECASRGVFEDATETVIRARAERNVAPPLSAPATPSVTGAIPPRASVMTAPRPLNVTIRVRFVDPDSTVTPVPNFDVSLIGERGDTTRVTTNALGTASAVLTAGRYRAVPPRRAEFDGRVYTWDVPFTVRTGMGPFDLTQRNARPH